MLKEYRTNFPRDFGQPDIVVWLDSTMDADANWLLSYFASQVRNGILFREDETIQIGWMIVKLKSDGRNALEVWEPQHDGIPIQWKRGADYTLRHLKIQNEICTQLHVEPDYPSLQQSGDVSSSFMDGNDGFRMNRNIAAKNASGWVLTSDTDKNSGNRCYSLFEIFLRRPVIMPFLGLPTGTEVICDKQKIEMRTYDRTLSSEDNSFLRKLYRSITYTIEKPS